MLDLTEGLAFSIFIILPLGMVFLVGILLFFVARLAPLCFWRCGLFPDLCLLCWCQLSSINQGVIFLRLGLHGTDCLNDVFKHRWKGWRLQLRGHESSLEVQGQWFQESLRSLERVDSVVVGSFLFWLLALPSLQRLVNARIWIFCRFGTGEFGTHPFHPRTE